MFNELTSNDPVAAQQAVLSRGMQAVSAAEHLCESAHRQASTSQAPTHQPDTHIRASTSQAPAHEPEVEHEVPADWEELASASDGEEEEEEEEEDPDDDHDEDEGTGRSRSWEGQLDEFLDEYTLAGDEEAPVSPGVTTHSIDACKPKCAWTGQLCFVSFLVTSLLHPAPRKH